MSQRPSSRLAIIPVLFFVVVGVISLAYAQTETGTIYGSVTDPTGAVVPNAAIRLIDSDRGIHTDVATDNSGFYNLASIHPGHFTIEVEKGGFKLVRLTGIIVNVQDNLEKNFRLALGSASEAITVVASAENLNTTDASVSTVVDNRFVENMPLNGRSFSSLLSLTPGVVLTAANGSSGETGQFSVNGQRPDANYFSVDGVSVNLGTSSTVLGQGGAGQLPATSAFGGMSNLASIDSLQEFRVQTSTFAPEFGRTPGAQVSVVTKSGTNTLHGTAFEYFRNDILDANDWFANNAGKKKAALRQNDFGGVLGGPIIKDKLFFFGSYEGLRVRLPKVANTYEPTQATRQSAPAAVQPLLNAFPQPNGADLGNGTADFTATYSDPSSLDSYSGRIDYSLNKKVTIFGRYSEAPSSTVQRAGAQSNYNALYHTDYRLRTMTIGSTQVFSPLLINEARFNYSRSRAHSKFTLDSFGGGVPPAHSVLFPSVAPENSNAEFLGDVNPFGLRYYSGELGNNLEQQINLTDNVSYAISRHQFKFGIDYRRIRPENHLLDYQAQYIFLSLANVLANNMPEAFVIARRPATLLFTNVGLFAQDTWKVTRTFTVTYGLRWEYNPAPSSASGTPPFTVNQVSDFATMTLAPEGTPLWHAQKDDFAPRLGIAWNPRQNLVIRAGGGIFYDLGYSQIANVASAFPNSQQKLILPTCSQGVCSPLPFPLTADQAAPPPFTTSPPVSLLVVVDPNHVLPRTYEWNAAVEQSLSSADVLTMTYVGAGGRKLMRRDVNFAPNSEFTGEFDVLSNHGTSSYNALQAEYRHRVSHGLQTLLSYTWGHSIDDVSGDGNFFNVPLNATTPGSERASSDYDIRQTFSGAVSYDIPGPNKGVLKQVFGNWSTDTIIYARSSIPVNVVTGQNPFPHTVLFGASSVQRPNVVPSVPFYLYGGQYPGGKIINANAFCVPSPQCKPFVAGQVQGDLGRNALRGFGATQWDITLRRQFRFTERFSLQFRGDFFNILNHPNFGNPTSYLTAHSPTPFGYASQMLNNYLGSGGQLGGLNPLYQIGGPRSIQLALKLQF